MAELGSGSNVVFENAARAYELETKRIEILADARLKDMQANSVEEHVLNQRLTNILKATSIDEYKAAILRFRSQRNARDAEVRRLQEAASNLGNYKLGHRIPDALRQNCWAAYQALLMKAPYSVILDWSTMMLTLEDVGVESDWIGRCLVTSKPCTYEEPEGIKTVVDLLDYQSENHRKVVVRLGSGPHVRSMRALSHMDAVWAIEVKRLQDDIKSIEQGHYDLWKPAETSRIYDEK